MSMTPVPISIRLVLAPIAASSGKGEESWRAKWWTRTNAPSIPISSAAIASSTVWRSASPPVWVSPPPGCQAPNERKPILFGLVIVQLFQPGPRRLAICRAREGVRGERAECLDVVRAGGEQGGDQRAGRLSFGKRPDHLS